MNSAIRTILLKKPHLILSDNFNRGDNTTLGNADTGQLWSKSGGSDGFAISSNTLLNLTALATHTARVDCGKANKIVQAIVNSGSGTTQANSLLIGYTNDSNYLSASVFNNGTGGNSFSLEKRVSGVLTTFAIVYITIENNINYLVKVVHKKGNLKMYVNGALLLTTYTEYLMNNTVVGVRTYSQNATGYYDDFKVYSI